MGMKLKPGERECPRCKEAIKVDATICKHCGTEFSAEDIKRFKDAKRVESKHAAFGCLGLVLLLGCCSLFFGGDDDPSASVPDKAGPTAKADAIKFYQAVTVAIAPCDAAGKKMAAAGESGNAVAFYKAADKMEDACLSTPTDIRAVPVPESVGRDVHAKLTKARETCDLAYVQRWTSAGTIKKALDDQTSVSRVAEVEQAADDASTGMLACAAALVTGAAGAGVTSADLEKEAD